MAEDQETICALATPGGVGAIGLIRISGKDSWGVVSKMFSKKLKEQTSHTVHFGTVSDKEDNEIDEVLVTLFEKGKSFTGEESAEISCHGSLFVQQKIIATLIESGCRLARPGEYTQRAFLNGRMDLSQAEAVADLIASESRSAHNVALRQLRGGFSNELKEVRKKLINFASLIELELDFAEEDVEFADRTELKKMVAEVLVYVRRLARSFELGNAIKNGVPVAIVGAPNTGKSTLLNQLLGEERAIVSNIEGTTRDVIEEILNIDGIQFRLIDTAGIREDAKDIEAIGIERSFAKIEQASIVLCLTDATKEKSVLEGEKWVKELSIKHPDKKVMLIVNKKDIAVKSESGATHISAKTGEGIAELKKELVALICSDFDPGNETIVSNSRHHEALTHTAEMLQKAQEGLNSGVTADFVAMDIRQAMFFLGAITGDISTEDLLGNIFSKFCIGK